MSEDAYLTNHCQHCDGGIEFPQHGVGAEIECPHCKRSIRLVMPPELEAAVPSAGQPVPEGQSVSNHLENAEFRDLLFAYVDVAEPQGRIAA